MDTHKGKAFGTKRCMSKKRSPRVEIASLFIGTALLLGMISGPSRTTSMCSIIQFRRRNILSFPHRQWASGDGDVQNIYAFLCIYYM